MKLKDFLKKKRNEVGLSQKELAKKLGYTTAQFVSNWERGISRPPMDSVPKIAKLIKANEKEIYLYFFHQDLEMLHKEYQNLI